MPDEPVDVQPEQLVGHGGGTTIKAAADGERPPKPSHSARVSTSYPPDPHSDGAIPYA